MAKTKTKCNRGHKALTLRVIVTEDDAKNPVLDETVENARGFLRWLRVFSLPLFIENKIEQLLNEK